VGGAYLFEKLRGKAEKEVGGRRLRQVATNNDGEGLRLELRLELRLRPTKGVCSGYGANSS